MGGRKAALFFALHRRETGSLLADLRNERWMNTLDTKTIEFFL